MSPLPRSTLIGYALLSVVVLVVGGRWLVAQARQGAAVSSSPRPLAAPRITRAPAAAALVDVTGAVRRPGVYRLPAGARVRDAVARAGGASRSAQTASVNLAAKVADGQQIVIPARASACAGSAPPAAAPQSGAASAGGPASGPVSLGSASAEQLEALPGVGPATAQKILDWRAAHGGFASVEDLGQVSGIGPKKLAALRPLVQP